VNYGELRTYVRDRLTISTGDAAKTTQINTAINQARYRLAAEFRLLEATASLNFTANTETVTIPADVTEILSIRQGTYVLQPITRAELAQYRAAQAAGTTLSTGPQVYVVDGASTTIRVWPVPTTTVTAAATIHYVQRPVALSADGDTPSEMPTEFHDLIAEEAVYRIAQSEEDFDLARGAAAATAELREGLRAYMNRRMGAGASKVFLRGFGR
jgi:hypothetical protein